jgi:predicted 2-oxoglutarate/Fe(II)-dependent dioxygenase YbiX
MSNVTLENLVQRARGGDPRALLHLGRRLLFGDGVAASPGHGYACILRAAQSGDAEAAAQLAVFAAWGVVRTQDWAAALDMLQRAAQLGSIPAQRQLQLLARAPGTDWATLRQQVDLRALTTPPPARALSAAPSIRAVDGFATRDECSWLIELARGSLRRAQVYRKDAAGYTEADSRTNSEADYVLGNADLVLRLVIERIANAAGLPQTHFEVAKLLHYEPGQQFAPHCDFQEPATPALAQEVALRGQRVATVLVYLNDDYDGGETEFPLVGLRHRAALGDALVFCNVKPDGALDYDTLHAGLAPTRGVKWVLSQWIRARPVDGGA